MGVNYTCDHCGEPIDDDYHRATVMVLGGYCREYGPSWYQRNYHAENGRPCWKTVGELMDAASEATPTPRENLGERFEGMQRAQREWPGYEERQHWKRTARPLRDRAVLEALADRRVTASEAVGCLREKLGHDHVYKSDVTQSLKRLLDAGEVLREETPGYRGGSHPRWIYFRNAELNGPIVDLERQFGGEETA